MILILERKDLLATYENQPTEYVELSNFAINTLLTRENLHSATAIIFQDKNRFKVLRDRRTPPRLQGVLNKHQLGMFIETLFRI